MKYAHLKRHVSPRAGFTLVEMIVALGIFTIVAVVAVGALLKITDSNKKAQAFKIVVNNVNAVLDSIQRDMNAGSGYCFISGTFTGSSLPSGNTCALNNGSLRRGSDVANANNGIATVVFSSSQVGMPFSGPGSCNLLNAYRFDLDTVRNVWVVEKAEQQYCDDAIGADSYLPVISPDVSISDYTARVESSDHAERMIVYLTGYAGVKEGEKTYFDVQTSISSRNPIP